MKLHCSKILLSVIPLSILVTLYHIYNNNEQSITPRYTAICTSRVLSECEIQSSIYDNDVDMKSVKESYDDRISQRFEEYEERMRKKRQKYKDQRDKNIQNIIANDKMEKSLAEKIEKGCLKCGCGLGGGVLPVWGLVGGLWYATLSQYVTKMATDEGIKAGIATVISELKDVAKPFVTSPIDISGVVNAKTYLSRQFLITSINREIQEVCGENMLNTQVCPRVEELNLFFLNQKVMNATEKGMDAAKIAEAKELAELTAKSSHMYSAIGYSILAILIIVLIMVIIYLVLRYRRKKKMNRKAQYTKLLNQ
ncbi:rifin PIR protein, putative [Plasmodium reichenowi]|uniref:Rifin PIR protein, putative n=1 Tax=Plasmodium reichenowi TaxID=5854 RepID=A0A2P9DSH3_PLARE|nr:rifin PIR protein, putative [Plasmodium reichenowi]